MHTSDDGRRKSKNREHENRGAYHANIGKIREQTTVFTKSWSARYFHFPYFPFVTNHINGINGVRRT
jgi:hypothetical protein